MSYTSSKLAAFVASCLMAYAQTPSDKSDQQKIAAANISIRSGGTTRNIPIHMSRFANENGEDMMVKVVRHDQANITVIIDDEKLFHQKDASERGSTVRWVTALQVAARLMINSQTGKPYSPVPAMVIISDPESDALFNEIRIPCVTKTNSDDNVISITCGRPVANKNPHPSPLAIQ